MFPWALEGNAAPTATNSPVGKKTPLWLPRKEHGPIYISLVVLHSQNQCASVGADLASPL